MLAAGSVASVIALTRHIGRDRRVQGVVSAVSSPASDVTEVVCQLGSAWRGHRAGQFAFVSCIGMGRFEGAHPFTIASADRGDRTLTFQIKALGDHTRQLTSRLTAGQAVTVEGPYGRFVLDRRDRKARQIWIAGGIGVTPFLAWLDELRADPATAPQVELHYSTRTAATDPFVNRLQCLCAELPSVTLLIHDSAADASLTPESLAGHRGTWLRARYGSAGRAASAISYEPACARPGAGECAFGASASNCAEMTVSAPGLRVGQRTRLEAHAAPALPHV